MVIELTGPPKSTTSEKGISGFSVSLKYTIHQNDVKSLMSSFSVESMFRTSLKYSSTSESTKIQSLRKMGIWYLGT